MKRNGEKVFKITAACVILLAVLGLSGCKKVVKYTSAGTAMGTFVYQTLYTEGEDVSALVEERVETLEQDTLSWRISGSEIAVINACAGNVEGIQLSEKLSENLAVLLEVSERSGGAFDITMQPVVKLWNIDAWAVLEDTEVILPEDAQIEEALKHTGYRALKLEGDTLFLPEGMQLDMGAAGKGIACDEIMALLKESEVTGAVVSVGGSVLTYGSRPDGADWQVAVVNPQDTTEYLGTLSLSGEWFVSTSGDYERYVEADGIRYHHILNPATGYPAESGVRGVTIVCDSGILSDALSTACFVLGVQDGMELAESYGAKALFADETGQIFMTENMKEIFKETGDK